MASVTVRKDIVVVEKLTIHDSEVVSFFAEVPEEARPEMAGKAVTFGVAGLRAMGVTGRVDIVEREFLKLATGFEKALTQIENRLVERVDSTFDPDEAESVTARLGLTIASAYRAASEALDGVRRGLERLVADSFNPELTTSCVYQIVKLVSDTRAELDRTFDPSFEGSHLARLGALIDDYFGESGSIVEVVSSQVSPVKDEVMQSLQDIRDLIVGQAAAAGIRRLSPASGFDFEDEVEVVLQQIAKAYGDSVERVGLLSGDGGTSKKGDFLVQTSEGHAFVVEAKDYSNPVSLRGSRGILAGLQASMENRGAKFSIAVMKSEGGFPKEVGHFNDYDGNKVLCLFGDRGELLETAYRWARTSLQAKANEKFVDVQTIEAGLDQVREALRDIARIEAKAKVISKGAEEIKTIVAFQMRRAAAGLEEASRGLSMNISKAS